MKSSQRGDLQYIEERKQNHNLRSRNKRKKILEESQQVNEDENEIDSLQDSGRGNIKN